MISINLIKNQVPEEVDIPKKLLKRRKIIYISIVISLSVILVIPLIFIKQSLMNLLSLKMPTKVLVQKQHVKENKLIKIKKVKKEKKVKNTNLNSKAQVTKKKSQPVISNKEKVKNIEKEVKNKPIFSIALEFENIPKKEKTKEINNELPPLPPVFKKQHKETPKKTKKNPPIYFAKIVTRNPKRVAKILASLGIKFSKKQIEVKSSYTYDIYVGGFYSYPQTLAFAKALRLKGYKVYSIKNINLLYYVCIDKNVSKRKMLAYKQAWGKTKFRSVFIKNELKIHKTIFTFTTPNISLINALKKRRVYPIIKTIKNGA